MMKQLTRKQRLDMVTGLYAGWKTREELRRHTFPVEALDGNVDLLSELLEQDFKDDEDMKRKVESWIEEKEESLKTQEEKGERYKKARFKKKLFEACLSRCKRRKK